MRPGKGARDALGDLKARSYVQLCRGRIDVLDPVAVLELADRVA